MNIDKGQMITFAQGEYSDYCVQGLVMAAVDFDLKAEQLKWEAQHTSEKPPRATRYIPEKKQLRVKGMEFLPWLIKEGVAVEVEYIEVHTGSYGESDITVDCDPII